MATMNISLLDPVRAQKLQMLQQAITVGIESGDPKHWNKEDFKARMKQQAKDAKL